MFLHVPVQADQEVPEGLRVHLGVLREVLVVPGVSVGQHFFSSSVLIGTCKLTFQPCLSLPKWSTLQFGV